MFALTLVAALGCGLSAGALFAFSSFVMQALGRLAPARGIEAMQSINVLAVTPAFMTALFGTAVLCAVLAIWGLVSLDEDYGPYLLIGGAIYLLGPIGLTMGYHVPRNNALAAVDPESIEGAPALEPLPGGVDQVEPRPRGRGAGRRRTPHHLADGLAALDCVGPAAPGGARPRNPERCPRHSDLYLPRRFRTDPGGVTRPAQSCALAAGLEDRQPGARGQVDGIVSLAMAMERAQHQPEPVKLLGWL